MVEGVVLFEDSGTLALLGKRGTDTGFKPKRLSSKPRISFKPSRPSLFVYGGLDGVGSNTVYRFLHFLAYIHDSFYRGARNLSLTRIIALQEWPSYHSHTWHYGQLLQAVRSVSYKL